MRVCFCLIVFFIGGFLYAPVVSAIGLGVYYSYGTGEANVDFDQGDVEFEEDYDLKNNTFGLVFDSCVARNSLFNYRLNIGCKNAEYEWRNHQLDVSGISMEHTFGFSLLRTRDVRLWIGPQLHLGFLDGDTNYDADITMIGWGLGPVLGLNFHTGSVVSFGIELGARYNAYFGNLEYKVSRGSSGYTYTETERDDVDNRETIVFLNFSLLFRIGDRY